MFVWSGYTLAKQPTGKCVKNLLAAIVSGLLILNTYVCSGATIRLCLQALMGLQALKSAFLKLLLDKMMYKQENLKRKQLFCECKWPLYKILQPRKNPKKPSIHKMDYDGKGEKPSSLPNVVSCSFLSHRIIE